MKFNPTVTGHGRLAFYPEPQPVAAGAAEVRELLAVTSLGRHALKLRADADGSIPGTTLDNVQGPAAPGEMDREERDELLAQGALGRAFLRRERRP